MARVCLLSAGQVPELGSGRVEYISVFFRFVYVLIFFL